MSINVQKNEVPDVKANIVPVHIKHNGFANTIDYFTPSKTTEMDHQVAYFRGCKFKGKEVALPPKTTAYLFNKEETMVAAPDTPQGFETSYNYTPQAKFDHFTVFGHETELDPASSFLTMGEWHEISQIIHGVDTPKE